jgi:SNF2 family DNA or RNA helicase
VDVESDGSLAFAPEVFSSGEANDAKDPRDDQFRRRFDRSRRIQDVYSVEDEEGARERIPVTERQKEQLRKIKSRRRVSDSNTIKEIIEDPSRLYSEEFGFDPDVVDISVLYGDRVIEIGIYKPRVYPFVSAYKSEWIPGFIVEDRTDGESRTYLRSEADVQELEEAIADANESKSETVHFRQHEIPMGDAKEVCDAARKQLRQPGTCVGNSENRVLIIKENAELLEYEDDHSLGHVEHLFEAIPNLSPGYDLKSHQVEGASWLQGLYRQHARGCLLADDMGL